VNPTAINNREDKIRAFNNCADDFVLKPIDEFILKSRIETLLKVKGLQEQIRQERDLALKYIDTTDSIISITTLKREDIDIWKLPP
jgi:hypothetical protein